MMKRFLTVMTLLVCLGVNAQSVSLHSFNTNQFSTNAHSLPLPAGQWLVNVNTNGVVTFGAVNTNSITTNGGVLNLNTNINSVLSNYVYNVVSGSPQVWTNDNGTIMPSDASVSFSSPSSTNKVQLLYNGPSSDSGGNPYIKVVSVKSLKTSSASIDIPGGALAAGISGWASGSDSTNGLSAGLFGNNDSPNTLKYGVLGVAYPVESGSTNSGIGGYAVRGANTGINGELSIGGYFGIIDDAGIKPNKTSAVIEGDSFTSGLPLLTLNTNNGATVFQVTGVGNLKWQGIEYAAPGSNLLSGQVFASDGGTPQQIYGVTLVNGITGGTTNFATTNTSTGLTNATASIVSNQIPNFIHGTSNYIAKFTPNSNEVGNSIVFEAATNLWEWRSRPSGSAFTNSITNRLMGEYTSDANYVALDIVSSSASTTPPTGSSEYSHIHGTQVGSGNRIFPLQIMDAWQFNSGLNSPGGITAGFLLPLVDNVYWIGTSTARVGAVFAGQDGYFATANSAIPGNFYSGSFGIGLSSTEIKWWDRVNSSEFLEMSTTTAGGNYTGLNLGTASLCANTFNAFGTPNIYLRGNVARDAGWWQLGTNHTSPTVTPQAYTLSGPNASGSNLKGGDLRISGGMGTGATNNGSVGFMTAEGVASASVANTPKWRDYIAPEPITLTESTATLVCIVSNITSGKAVTVYVTATTKADDGTAQQIVGEKFVISAGNVSGTMGTPNVSASAPMSTFTSSGTLTTAWTAGAVGNGIGISNNAVSSLSQTTLNTRWRIELDSDTIPAIYDGGVKHQ